MIYSRNSHAHEPRTLRISMFPPSTKFRLPRPRLNPCASHARANKTFQLSRASAAVTNPFSASSSSTAMRSEPYRTQSGAQTLSSIFPQLFLLDSVASCCSNESVGCCLPEKACSQSSETDSCVVNMSNSLINEDGSRIPLILSMSSRRSRRPKCLYRLDGPVCLRLIFVSLSRCLLLRDHISFIAFQFERV